MGWIFFVEFFIWQLVIANQMNSGPGDSRWILTSLVSLSPVAGPLEAMNCLFDYSWAGRGKQGAASGLAIAVKLCIAAGLFWLTVGTFDRCLGRMAESRRKADPMSQPLALEPVAAGAS